MTKPRRLVQGMSLEEMKKLERPAFTPVPMEAPVNAAYIVTRRTKRSMAWRGYLIREGFRWAQEKAVWVYDKHDDGTLVTPEEAEWVAEKVRETVAGDLTFSIGRGLFVEPATERPARYRFWIRPKSR